LQNWEDPHTTKRSGSYIFLHTAPIIFLDNSMNPPRSFPLVTCLILCSLLITVPAFCQSSAGQNCLSLPGNDKNHTGIIGIADNGQLAVLYYQNAPELFVYNGNGSLLWNVTLSAGQTPWLSSAGIAPNGSTVAVAQLVPGCCHGTVTNTTSNKVILFDAATGTKLWEYPTMSPPLSTVISGNDRDILAGTQDGRIVGLDRNGTLRWTAQVDAPVLSLAGSRDGSTIVATGDSNYLFSKTYHEPISPHDLFAFRENGTLLWNYQTQGWNAALVSDDGSEIAAVEKVSGTLYLFNRSGPVAVVPVYPGGLESFSLAGDKSLIVARTPKGDVYSFTGIGSRAWTLPAEWGSRGIAITGTDDAVVLGNGDTLIQYSRSRTQIANQSIDGPIQAVAAARDTDAIVALTDQSLCFFPQGIPAPGTGSSGSGEPVTIQSPQGLAPTPSHETPASPLVPVLALFGCGLGIATIKKRW
jgi:outer membrane protein assembly factor BamB